MGKPGHSTNNSQQKSSKGPTHKGSGDKKGRGGKNKNSQGRKRNSRNNRSRKGRRRQGPRLSPEERVVKKYENLLEQHAHARRKYFDLFNLADPQQKDKLERNFYKTLEDVRSFEDSLTGEEREAFLRRFHNFGEVDRTYTQNHDLDPEGTAAPEGPFEDPHVLEVQRESSYTDDSEESVGTMDDYIAYKEDRE